MLARNYFRTIFVSLALLVFPFPILALSGPGVTLSILPSNPSPNEMVSVSVSASEFNIDLSKISWTVDGKKIKEGVGEKGISFSAPANGKSAVVKVSVTTPSNLIIENSVTVSPADVDILWEAIDGYAPPFYKGKVLPIKQSGIRVVAMPNVKLASGKSAQAGDFVYNWKKDGENLSSQSGFARNSIFFSNQILDTQNRIDVSATNGSKTVSGTLTITPFTPEIIFYEDDANKGIQYQNALKNPASIKTARLAIVAEPYFLLKDFKKNKDAVIDWLVNNQKINAQTKNEVILNTANLSTLSVSASYNETKRLFRNFSANLNVNIRK